MGASRLKVAQLPEDLILEILYRLSVKSLVRFKSVCKTWNQFLKSCSFISMHHEFNLGRLNSQLLMYSTSTPKKEDITKRVKSNVFSILSNDKSTTVLSPDLRILADPDSFVYLAANSCNGIVCYFDLLSDTIFLSNPAIREFRQLPPSTFHLEKIELFWEAGVALGFDSANIYDFKVLRVLPPALTKEGCPQFNHKGCRAEIFTLSSNTWKQLHWGLDDKVKFYYTSGFFFSYCFHFIVMPRKSGGRPAIACCDTHTERFTTMELPSAMEGSCASELTVFKEFLSTSAVDHEGESMSLWIMKDYGAVESWTKLYSIRLPSRLIHPPLFWTVEDALLIQLYDGKLVSCHLNTQTFDSIEIQGYELTCRFLVHQETLVSIM